MNKIKNSLYIVAVLIISAAFSIAAAMPDMNYVGKVMFGFFGMAGFAMMITYMFWNYNRNRKKSSVPQVANRGPVKRTMNTYYKKSA